MNLDAPISEDVNGDEFIAEFMHPDKTFESEADKLKHLRSAQTILRDEILCAYEFMDKQGLLNAYKEYRDED